MSAMRKVKFAVLESSLLARKGAAKPAMSPGALQNDPLDDEPSYHAPPAHEPSAAEVAAAETEVLLASLISRAPARPQPQPEQSDVAAEEVAEAPVEVASAPAPSPVEEVKAWTRKVAKDRRLAHNLHPRGLNRDQAAQYVGLSMTTFNRLVAEGVLPSPLHFGRRRVWDRRALDAMLDQLSGAARPTERSTDDV